MTERRTFSVLEAGNRQLQSQGGAPVSYKRVYRTMQTHNLLLARKHSACPEHLHDGKLIVIRSNLRWRSDGFEFACWNGNIVRGAFISDPYDREIIAWCAVVNAGIGGLDSATSCGRRWKGASTPAGRP